MAYKVSCVLWLGSLLGKAESYIQQFVGLWMGRAVEPAPRPIRLYLCFLFVLFICARDSIQLKSNS